MTNDPRGWYSREYLPHFDGGEITQFVTFTLWDSVPHVVLRKWHDELAMLEKMKREIEWKRRIEIYIDCGEGHAWFKNPILADLVQNALMYFHGQRYLLHAWVIMPNHVHAMFTLLQGFSLESILHSWKSFTANEANKILGKQGEFWYPESFDRYIRDSEHYNRVKKYIEDNPPKAKLCLHPTTWRWNSAYWREAQPQFHFDDPECYKV